MTETAKSLIIDAFEDIVSLTSETPLEASDAQTAIRALNRLMATLSATGLSLGYTAVSKLSDPITISDGATDAVIALLAMRLWPKYRAKELPSYIIINARRAMATIAHIAVPILSTAYPSTLPIGSGNESIGDEKFYPDQLDSILTETDGLISVEESTNE